MIRTRFISFALVLAASIPSLTVFAQSVRPQNPPSLGAAATFALFTTAGAVGNTDNAASVCANGCDTAITGDVGTNGGDITMYKSGEIVGTTYLPGSKTAQAASDLSSAYTKLGQMTVTGQVTSTVMNGGTVYPGIYQLTGAAFTINQVLTLDGKGDPNAVFVFLSDNALSTSVGVQIILANGTVENNVFWRVGGGATFGAQTGFTGIVLANGVVAFGDRAILKGKALSIGGAISTLSTRIQTTPAVALPVELTAFTAAAEGNSVQLQWATASEKNSAYFVVERSDNGRSFGPLGRVAAQGTASQPHDYSWTDSRTNSTSIAPVYYRLRQVDTDGATTYSPVRAVADLAIGPLQLEAFPNPSQRFDVLITATQAGPAALSLIDALGHPVLQRRLNLVAGQNSLALDEAQITHPGIYLLHLQQGKQLLTKTLVRQ